ncbi:hypothetical protein [Campylobacter ureolyticus]|uniref:Uncharacterized protein n=1 Tax=Campylobacter ureolyticus TaxID=827 RepID=A0AAE7E9H4_9BACT|nr:hypothetical protein [Campylobacter ureolyticus]MCR8684566.1 hypothetical protein [Campylobacter ureolyticus]QKF84144.1 hypothetical protein CURT_0633 [Campylobacter ureolyticus]QQY35712.1 hypothetical protein I6I59_00260 [Campylobacter ureolyticus]SUX23946.1 Uncharacterised protein [Campylobacter ureolyticus]
MNILKDSAFFDLMKNHAKECLEYLLERNRGFNIVVNLKNVKFNPELPKEISDNFSNLIMFELGNYTLESAFLEDDFLIFEAGFGNENFASTLSVPLSDIIQINLKNQPIFINLSIQEKKDDEEDKRAKSKKIFSSK